jgi:TRAP-type transport system small permease protein
MLDRWADGFCRVLSVLMAGALALIVILVFGNVFLRYAFNSGIAVSEELSRWLFVWMVFLGAVVAIREKGHLGTDMLISKLPLAGKKAAYAIGHLAMLAVCWWLFQGAIEQTKINLGTTSAIMEAPVAIFYASGVFFSIAGATMLALNLLQLLSGRLTEAELVGIKEAE